MGSFRTNRGGGFNGRPSTRSGRGFNPRNGGSGGSRGFGDRGGRSEGGFGGGRDSGRGERRFDMFDAVCEKCGKKCQVPFRPTGSKPVFCSDCFRKNDSPSNFSGSRNQSSSQGSEASSAQMSIINAKLDKIIAILKELELDVVDDEDEDDVEETEDEIEEDL